jgi:hypothetical protein
MILTFEEVHPYQVIVDDRCAARFTNLNCAARTVAHLGNPNTRRIPVAAVVIDERNRRHDYHDCVGIINRLSSGCSDSNRAVTA